MNVNIASIDPEISELLNEEQNRQRSRNRVNSIREFYIKCSNGGIRFNFNK